MASLSIDSWVYWAIFAIEGNGRGSMQHSPLPANEAMVGQHADQRYHNRRIDALRGVLHFDQHPAAC